uniref:Uncharacterized protein n=1 Tax=Rhizophora mucronata TaxID=61149 RepID=A0A2P2NJR3_RHIMU
MAYNEREISKKHQNFVSQNVTTEHKIQDTNH